ncbi:hypothetical protein [Methylobacterium longum]|uniref:Uncharacterized protein n=1 Tax=Methylobacterium longum TaxID=767694 RepID=A0ABT8ARK9_9HYPH|nr:hypothetical protein [Methylobacterium longum]MDN3572337.1 hypothetical protein [Methylobacterium longum]GJE09518.1 hypothetical protein FOHLNKBM_0542 [Methylobacterium longum]
MATDQLSLYLDIEEGQRVDLEVISKTSLAVLATIKDIAAFVDPFSDVSLDLVDTAEGSLWLNTRTKINRYVGDPKKTAAAILLAAVTWIGHEVWDTAKGKIKDHVWEDVFGKDAGGLTDKDKQDISDIVVQAIRAKAGQKKSQEVFSELERDTAVKGAAVTGSNVRKPKHVVPRSEFYTRGGYGTVETLPARKRTTTEPTKVVLISPVLEPGTRRWKFKIGKSEFGAPVKDKPFVDDVLSGHLPIVMKSNVQMTVLLETVEEDKGKGWVPVERTVLKVLSAPTQFMNRQTSLPLDDQEE